VGGVRRPGPARGARMHVLVVLPGPRPNGGFGAVRWGGAVGASGVVPFPPGRRGCNHDWPGKDGFLFAGLPPTDLTDYG
jgi:hypothetical protein